MKILEKSWNECKGCYSFIKMPTHDEFGKEVYTLQCGTGTVPIKNSSILRRIKCPCSTCLVKTMCTRGCSPFNEYKKIPSLPSGKYK